MSSNRSKSTRLSLRKKSNSKSSNHHEDDLKQVWVFLPQPLQLNAESSVPSKPMNKLQTRSQVIRSKSSSSSSSPIPHQTSYGANPAIANILEANHSISHQQMSMSFHPQIHQQKCHIIPTTKTSTETTSCQYTVYHQNHKSQLSSTPISCSLMII